MRIRVLSEAMASRIAAGEVVERPASVVKELVENSLDAGANEISVWLEKSGTALIRVSDNGGGIVAEDLALALERHSTSKLTEENDLFQISTLGFRGEALPSIASVSRLEIVSRPPSASAGHRLRAEGGNKGTPFAAGCAVGTTVEIRDLFFNTPARKKFLKSPATELSHVCDVLNRMALAFERVHFRLVHGGRVISDYPAVGDAKDRLHQVLGAEISRNLVPFRWHGDGLTITGYLSSAPVSFPNSRYLLAFVNRRFVRDRVLTHAVLQGYDTLLMKGRFPAAVIYLEVPFRDVDVNVHPVKYEVRFCRQSEVHDAVTEAVRQALRREAKNPSLKVSVAQPQTPWLVKDRPLPYKAPEHGHARPAPAGSTAAERLEGAASGEGFFSSMNILGQVLGCYLICSSARGLAVIDQHAAHERIAFEKMRRQLESGEVETQNLLIPQTIDLLPAEALVFEPRMALLARLGFNIEPFGPNTYAIMTAPALLPPGDYREGVKQMIAEMAEVEKSETLRKELEERLATIACHSVIRANRRLEGEEIRALLKDLDRADFATQCPHGRPVLIEFTKEQLEGLFKRI